MERKKPSREIGRLSARKVATITKPGLHHDGGGLYLQVTESGTKSWLYRYATGTGKNRRERWMGLGPVSVVSLGDARLAAAECWRQRWAAKDPIDERRAARVAAQLERAKAVTFRAAAELCVTALQAGWRNAKHAAQWRARLETYVYPIFGDVPVQDVDVTLAMKVLEPIWTTKTETASRVRGRIESVLD